MDQQGSHTWKITEPTPLLGTAPVRLLERQVNFSFILVTDWWGAGGGGCPPLKNPTYISANAYINQV